jgi:hypothetical protein
MHPEQMEELLINIDRRVGRIEQILPTLPTKADLQAAISELEQRMRTHFDVVAESRRDDIQLIATGLASFSHRER